MKNRSLLAYFLILVILCAAFIAGARAFGEQGIYLAQGYMMTPAIAAAGQGPYPCRGEFDRQRHSIYKMKDMDNGREALRGRVEFHMSAAGALQEQFNRGVLRKSFHVWIFRNGQTMKFVHPFALQAQRLTGRSQ
jgi:hypothetical protein